MGSGLEEESLTRRKYGLRGEGEVKDGLKVSCGLRVTWFVLTYEQRGRNLCLEPEYKKLVNFLATFKRSVLLRLSIDSPFPLSSH